MSNELVKDKILSTLQSRYHYFLTGFIVIFLIISSLLNLSKTKITPKAAKISKIASTQVQPVRKVWTPPTVKTYTVQKGDHLWKIATDAYGSGYKAYDIAKANNISNPSVIYEGQKLILPDIKNDQIAENNNISSTRTEQVVKKVDKYTVQKGDHLWKIAQEVYGDGQAWARLARINNLSNPSLIYAGNVLKIE